MRKNLYFLIKRMVDLVVSSLLFVILLIPFVIIAILIKLEDGGPVFFKQKRVGKNLKEFYIYKFRSMKTTREQFGGELSHEDMVTNIGKVLRKTSIDELPQIMNVLKGEMTLIGPRPWIPEYYEWFTEEQKRRSDVTPGISGLAQVKREKSIGYF